MSAPYIAAGEEAEPGRAKAEAVGTRNSTEGVEAKRPS